MNCNCDFASGFCLGWLLTEATVAFGWLLNHPAACQRLLANIVSIPRRARQWWSMLRGGRK